MQPIRFELDNHVIEIRITRKMFPGMFRPSVSGEEILAATECVTGYSRKTLLSRQRCQQIVDARWAAIYTMNRRGFRLMEIMKTMKKKDHTTISYAIRHSKDLYSCSPRFRDLVKQISGVVSSSETSPCQPQGTPSQPQSEQVSGPSPLTAPSLRHWPTSP